tara:strand:- start:34 stop:3180 length:3147 start_codon:yes stop_codon:yes gene_type:complete
MALPEKDIYTAEELGISSTIKLPQIKVTPEQDIFTAEELGIGSTNTPMTGTYPGWEADARGYGAEIGTSDVGHGMRMLKSKFPQALSGTYYNKKLVDGIEMYIDPLTNNPMADEKSIAYAERKNREYDEFQSLQTYDERREYLKQKNIEDASRNYPKLTQEMKESGQALTGEIGGSLMSPTTLYAGPVALLAKGDKLFKAATKFGVLSGLWGAEYSTLQQASDTGEIDPLKVGKDAGLAATFGFGLRGGAPIIAKGIKKTGGAAINKTTEAINKLVLKEKTELSAAQFVDEMNVQAAEIIRNNGARDFLNIPGVFNSSGVVDQKVLTTLIKKDLAKKAGRSVKDVEVMEKSAGRKFIVPENQTEAINTIAEVRFDKYTNPDKNPFKHKLLQSISGKVVEAGRGIETIITPAYEKLKAYAPELAAKVAKMDFNILTKGNRLGADTKKFVEQVASLDETNKNLLKKALSNGDFSEAVQILGNDVGFQNVRKVLERLRTEAIKAGIKIDKVEDYFPRYVKNHQSYLDRVNAKVRNEGGTKVLTELEGVYADLRKFIKMKHGRAPTTEEKVNEVNKFMQGQTKRKTSRVMMRIDEELIDEYLDPIQALERYIISSINKTEKAKFFGKYARLDSGDGNEYLEESIGAMADTFSLGTRTAEVKKVLRARLVDGEQGSGIMQPLKNLTYMNMLANPSSAITQGGDVGFSAAQSGMFRSVKNLMKQMGRQKFGDKLKYNIEEIGLGKNVSAEIGGTQKGMDKAVVKLFDLSQFTRVDRVGKTTTINSALEKAMDIAKLNNKGTLANPKQFQQFKNEWEGVLGKEGFVNLVASLRTGRKTDDLGFYLFSELSKVQPVSLFQMPVGYLTAKNGKILYTLKSFGLKQLDFARRKILTEIGRGEYKSAFKNTLVLSATLGGSQTITDQLKKLAVGSPEEIKVEDIPDEFAENLMNIIFLSKYSTDKLAKDGDILEFIYDIILPPVEPIGDLIMDTIDYLDKPETVNEIIDDAMNPEVPFKRSRKNIPLAGRVIDEQTVKKPKRKEDELKELMKGLNLEDI